MATPKNPGDFRSLVEGMQRTPGGLIPDRPPVTDSAGPVTLYDGNVAVATIISIGLGLDRSRVDVEAFKASLLGEWTIEIEHADHGADIAAAAATPDLEAEDFGAEIVNTMDGYAAAKRSIVYAANLRVIVLVGRWAEGRKRRHWPASRRRRMRRKAR